MYQKGQGHPQDYAERSVVSDRRDQNYAPAQNNLRHVSQRHGRSAGPPLRRCVVSPRRRAGPILRRKTISAHVRTGSGYSLDYVQAHVWFTLSWRSQPDAATNKARVTELMSPPRLPRRTSWRGSGKPSPVRGALDPDFRPLKSGSP